MKLTVSATPHIRGNATTGRIMLTVILSLLPALVAAVVLQGWRALAVVLVTVLSAVVTELLYEYIVNRRITIKDFSAAVTGLLLAFTLPSSVPYHVAVLGAVIAIMVIKGFSGGLGQNIFNPALASRAILMFIFPSSLTRFSSFGYKAPVLGEVDMVSSATPLHHMVMPSLPDISLSDAFLGRMPGTIGETCTLLLLAGGLVLILLKVISVRIPLSYLGSVAVLTLVFHRTDDAFLWMLYELLTGGVVLAAFFMATDYVTSPTTRLGQILYGIGCGALTVFFRYTGLFPEGVTYSILIMNALVWLIDLNTAPRIYGCEKGGRV